MNFFASTLGSLGLASLACWGAALLCRGLLGRRPSPPWMLVAWSFSAMALVLGLLALQAIAQIQLDQTEERKAKKEEKRKIKESALKALKARAAKVRFAEDTSADRLDIAGIKKIDQPVLSAANMELDNEETGAQGKTLPEPEFHLARRYGRMNLAAAILAFLLMTGALFHATLRRRSQGPEATLVLPFALPLIDRLYAQTRPCSFLPCPLEGPALFLGKLVRRGESFITMNGCPPGLPENLPRFPFGLSTTRVVCQSERDPARLMAEVLKVWQGGQVLAVEGRAREVILEVILEFLRQKAAQGESPSRAMYLVWLPPAPDLGRQGEELQVLALRTHLHLLFLQTTNQKRG